MKTTFKWETINRALVKKGYSTKKISDILIMLTHEAELEVTKCEGHNCQNCEFGCVN